MFPVRNPELPPPTRSLCAAWRALANSGEPRYSITCHTSGASRNAAALMPPTRTGWPSSDGK